MHSTGIDWDLLAAHLKDHIQTRGVSNRAAAAEVGCSPATLGRLLQGASAPNTPDTDVLLRATSWLGRGVGDFLVGEKPHTSSFADVEMHLRALPKLDEEAKDNLVAVVRALHDQYRLRAQKG